MLLSVSEWSHWCECRSRLRPWAIDELLQPVDQIWCQAKELIAMEHRQAAQGRVALAGESDQHPSAVERIGVSLDQTARLHAVDQTDRAMVANLQPVGGIRDGGTPVGAQTAEHEQQLIVLWLEASRLRSPLAEREIPPDESPSLGEVGVVIIS
jgi:hypothetical protein